VSRSFNFTNIHHFETWYDKIVNEVIVATSSETVKYLEVDNAVDVFTNSVIGFDWTNGGCSACHSQRTIEGANVSWHTSDGIYDRLVFQNTQTQVHTLKFDGFSKSISADLKTMTIGMPLTSEYTILADELPGSINGRDASVYRQIYPKFKSDELTVILKFSIIDRIDGNTALNAGVHAPFLLISNDNTTTATLNQILMLRRTSNKKGFLQVFVHAENTRLGSSSINSYQDVSIENMGTGGTHYITASFGNGNFQFSFMECNNGVVTVGESYSRGSMTLNYRQREPYHVTINSDISDVLGMGVNYERFDFFSKYKSENEIKEFISEIDLL